MSQYERRVSLAVGAVLLAVFGFSLWNSLDVIAEDPTSGTAAALVAGGAAMLVGGIAFVLAGRYERLTLAGHTVDWWHLRAVGFVFLGGYMMISGLVQESVTSVLGLSMLAGGAGFATFGVYRLRNDPEEATEPSARAVATIVVGTVGTVVLLALLTIWFA